MADDELRARIERDEQFQRDEKFQAAIGQLSALFERVQPLLRDAPSEDVEQQYERFQRFVMEAPIEEIAATMGLETEELAQLVMMIREQATKYERLVQPGRGAGG